MRAPETVHALCCPACPVSLRALLTSLARLWSHDGLGAGNKKIHVIGRHLLGQVPDAEKRVVLRLLFGHERK